MESAATQHAAGPGTQTSCCSGAGSESHRLGTGRTTSPPSGKERGFIILWEPSAKGTLQFSLESHLHHSPCCRSSQPSPRSGRRTGSERTNLQCDVTEGFIHQNNSPAGPPSQGSLQAEAAFGGHRGIGTHRHMLLPHLIPVLPRGTLPDKA